MDGISSDCLKKIEPGLGLGRVEMKGVPVPVPPAPKPHGTMHELTFELAGLSLGEQPLVPVGAATSRNESGAATAHSTSQAAPEHLCHRS